MNLQEELNKSQFLLVKYGLIIVLVVLALIILMLFKFKINNQPVILILVEYYIG